MLYKKIRANTATETTRGCCYNDVMLTDAISKHF